MSTTAHTMTTTATKRVPMTSLRKTSLTAGVLYLITFVSIPTLFLYGPVKDPNYIVGSGPDTQVLVGGLLEIIVALAGIGTAVTLYPVIKRQNQGVALGFVAIADPGSRHHLRRRREPALDRDPAAGRRRTGCTGHRPGADTPSTTGRSCSDRPSCRGSTPCCWAP